MGICYLCGKEKETRPYGKEFRDICFECGMLPENYETTCKNFEAQLIGITDTNIENPKMIVIGGECGPIVIDNVSDLDKF